MNKYLSHLPSQKAKKQVDVIINDDSKKITVNLNCAIEESFDAFNRTVITLGKKYSGYYIESLVGKSSDGIDIVLYARIH